MSNTEPVGDLVADKLYRLMMDEYPLWRVDSEKPFAELPEERKDEWRRRAAEVIQPMLDAAAEAYSRGGRLCDADVLDVETQEIASSVTRQFRDWRRAFRSSTEEYLTFPNASVGAALDALAALRAAFGWAPTPTAPEVTESMRSEEVQTPFRDGLRLHLASAHAYPIALGAGDGEATVLHIEMHRRGRMEYEHQVTDHAWSEDMIRHAIDALVHEGYPSGQFIRPLQAHLDRAPHTASHDALRLHLLSAHCLLNAAELRDHEVADAHEHEHTGPGTIRNHPHDDRSWTVDKIHEVLDDLRDDWEQKARYLEATDKAMTRLREHTQ